MTKIIVIVGPTASGKSALGVKIAKKVNGEIISADSRQIYKGLDIGSGKITKKEMRGVPHHCLSIADPKKVYTADDYRKCAQSAIADILARGKTPIIAGGTGFYIDAALSRVRLGGVPPNQKLRRKLSKKSTPELLKILKKLDPRRAKTIEQKNPRRLIRAIEISRAQHAVLPTSHFQPPAIQWFGIKRSPEELKKRIHNRLLKRLVGITKEVRKLHKQGLSWKRLYDLGLEYRYVSLYLQGGLNYKLMTTQLQTASWHYARRQMTWFKKNKKIRWVSGDNANMASF